MESPANVIDLHCHIVPGVDDGPPTIEDSVALCRAAYEAGTSTIIATPHVNRDYPAIDAAVVHAGVTAIKSALREASIDVKVLPGAEMGLSRVADLSDAEVGVLRLGGGPYVLVACPHGRGAPVGIQDTLRLFATRGYSVVLAHPERSLAFRSHRRLLKGLVGDGMLCCVTARSLTGGFGLHARALAWELLAAGLVHAIASDAHDVVDRSPDLGPELKRAGLGQSEIDYFTCESPEAIIAGASVPPPPLVAGPYSGRWLPPRRRRRPSSLRSDS